MDALAEYARLGRPNETTYPARSVEQSIQVKEIVIGWDNEDDDFDR